MSDGIKTQKRRLDLAAQRGVARYGDATGSRNVGKVPAPVRGGVTVNFSSPGLALLGLRRRVDELAPPRGGRA